MPKRSAWCIGEIAEPEARRQTEARRVHSPQSPMRHPAACLPALPALGTLLASCLLAAGASASIDAATSARSPALRIDARGYAEVSWSQDGARRTLLVPPQGRYLPGGRILGADVSEPISRTGIANAVLARRTPDGRLWALQSWRPRPGGPVELRLARWKGAPTEVEASVTGARLRGRATYHGRGVYGTSPTTAGKPVAHFAWVDCWRCAGAPGWKRLLGVRLRGPEGTFALLLRPAWKASRYRVTVTGPNRGGDYAPDATTIAVRKRS